MAAIPEISHIGNYLVVIRLCALGNFHFYSSIVRQYSIVIRVV
jgi:hypothetical protein